MINGLEVQRRTVLAAIAATALSACADKVTGKAIEQERRPLFGKVERLDAALDEVIDSSAQLEQLADGFAWSEGPAWDRQRDRLYFSDVPQNTAFVWSEKDGLGIFRKPSGLAEGDGTNGLLMARDGRLLTANHGKRAITAFDLESGDDTILADRFEGKKFNSPNDLVEAKDGTIYFTDPPYGLKGGDESPLKEQPVNGVYRRGPEGGLSLIDGSLTRPNGIALSPDERTLYVAQSDRDKQLLKSYALGADGTIMDNGLFFDAQPLAAPDAPGLPDGMCVAQTGHIFATGPGGVLILSSTGKLLGRILAEKATANCAFGNDGDMLYLTSSNRLARIPLKVKGLGFR
ncbi:SMP-30/gluconolactonase/LRE family protein [Parasphingorhabdus cellanae]|uniref:SMP-30/gluconolactonase/LRE family protein n=1 Tax=Parasphingorhabdus cellanae TaxID=2806553 RepID=A0ABX7T2I8_9SPHN|nr:SMP-30/gluconolactonase/LRE family protein [Parasphingorhabdus cellanae]QTD55765.1 SMP-30/gluconolactonase/LRE family protein [Parasphingorhabdus cellanae]